ncbi:MAG: beta-ketoacyl-[acyl-carrier-protein] synthase family protein [Myxococcales bacterium]
MNDARVWITGVGLVTALGMTRETTWQALIRGDRAIRPVSLFDVTGQRVAIAAEVSGLTHEPLGKGESRTSRMAVLAAREALEHGSIDARDPRRRFRLGAVVGGTTAGMFETEALLARLHVDPEGRDAPADMLAHPMTSTADHLEAELGPFNRLRTLSSACSSGANAVLVGALWVRLGLVDVALVGGADGLCRLTLSGFNALGAVDPSPCRPFDRRRRGLSLGEGAGFLVLESASHARSRGVTSIAELAGWAAGAEAHHITNPEPDGALVASLLTRALSRAGLGADSLDYVNAHGTGTPLNDAMEASALARALGEHIARVPVSSCKGQLGHTLGAAGAIEGAVAALTVARQWLVPTAGLDQPDCALVHVPHVGRPARVRAALSSSFGFGGMDTALLFTEPELGASPVHATHRVVVTGAASLGPSTVLEVDPVRGRRLDRLAVLGAVLTGEVVRQSGLDPSLLGLVLGNAFGNVDGSAAFMHRVFEKGPRFASPAEFPNLVPSSPVGHVSIYHGLRGPVFAVADLGASGEAALVAAVELVSAGECVAAVAAGMDSHSRIVERVLRVLFSRSEDDVAGPREEAAAALVVENEDAARARGAKVLATIEAVVAWRAIAGIPWEQTCEAALEELPLPADAAEVVVIRRDTALDQALDRSAWGKFPRTLCVGEHDVRGAVAVVLAVGRLGSGSILVVGVVSGRGHAVLLGPTQDG